MVLSFLFLFLTVGVLISRDTQRGATGLCLEIKGLTFLYFHLLRPIWSVSERKGKKGQWLGNLYPKH